LDRDVSAWVPMSAILLVLVALGLTPVAIAGRDPSAVAAPLECCDAGFVWGTVNDGRVYAVGFAGDYGLFAVGNGDAFRVYVAAPSQGSLELGRGVLVNGVVVASGDLNIEGIITPVIALFDGDSVAVYSFNVSGAKAKGSTAVGLLDVTRA